MRKTSSFVGELHDLILFTMELIFLAEYSIYLHVIHKHNALNSSTEIIRTSIRTSEQTIVLYY